VTGEFAAAAQNGYALSYASAELWLWADREVALAAVAQDGYALSYASAEVRADQEVVLAAVAQEGHALEHASAELRADWEVVRAAVAQRGWALKYASAELRADREVALVAMRPQITHDGDLDPVEHVSAALCDTLVLMCHRAFGSRVACAKAGRCGLVTSRYSANVALVSYYYTTPYVCMGLRCLTGYARILPQHTQA
jgi:hypothetical protein